MRRRQITFLQFDTVGLDVPDSFASLSSLLPVPCALVLPVGCVARELSRGGEPVDARSYLPGVFMGGAKHLTDSRLNVERTLGHPVCLEQFSLVSSVCYVCSGECTVSPAPPLLTMPTPTGTGGWPKLSLSVPSASARARRPLVSVHRGRPYDMSSTRHGGMSWGRSARPLTRPRAPASEPRRSACGAGRGRSQTQ